MRCFLIWDNCEEVINLDHIVLMQTVNRDTVCLIDTNDEDHVMTLPECKDLRTVMLDIVTAPKDQGYICVTRSNDSKSGYIVSTHISY